MATDIAAGIPGLALQAGDHVCAFYRGPEGRDEVLLPFLRAGLLAGDKCLAVLDEADPVDVASRLADVIDPDVGNGEAQLEVLTSAESYLRGGAFSSPEMLAFWNVRIGRSLGQQGYTFARSLGEMTWALRDLPGVEYLVTYEAELNEFLPQYPQVILCLYDLDRFDGGLIVDLLRTHPRTVMCGTVIDNPYYTEPAAFLAARRR